MSIVWCLGFLAVLYGSTVIFGLGTFVGLGAMSPQPAESLREEVKKARAWAAYMQANPKPEGDPVPVPENVSFGIAGGGVVSFEIPESAFLRWHIKRR